MTDEKGPAMSDLLRLKQIRNYLRAMNYPEDAACISDAIRDLRHLDQRLKAVQDFLRSLEWSDMSGRVGYQCPECHAGPKRHKADCRLAKALAPERIIRPLKNQS